MFKNLIWVVITVFALGVIVMFSTVTSRADSDTNSGSNVNASVNATQGAGSSAQPDSAIKNWHEIN